MTTKRSNARVSDKTLFVAITIALVTAAGIGTMFSRRTPEAAAPVPTPAPVQSGNRWAILTSLDEYNFDTGNLKAVPPGLAAFEVSNEGRLPHELQMFALRKGVQYAKFERAASRLGRSNRLFDLAYPVGGVGAGGGLDPGESQRVVLDLDLGTYAFVSFIRDDHEKGMIKRFDVLSAQPVPAGTPPSLGTIALVDTSFELPNEALAAGVYSLTNEGKQIHEAAIFALGEGGSQQLLANLGGGRERGGEAGFSLLAPGRATYAQLNLTPGSYAFVCRVIDPVTGRQHFEQGMVREFEVL